MIDPELLDLLEATTINVTDQAPLFVLKDWLDEHGMGSQAGLIQKLIDNRWCFRKYRISGDDRKLIDVIDVIEVFSYRCSIGFRWEDFLASTLLPCLNFDRMMRLARSHHSWNGLRPEEVALMEADK